MAGSGQDSSDPPEGGRPARKPRSFTPLAAMRAQVQEGAKELVVDDFVDTYFQERPKTLPPISARGTEPPAPPPEPPRRAPPRPGHSEESGVRLATAVAAQARGTRSASGSPGPSPTKAPRATPPANVLPADDDDIELSVAEHEEDLVVMEAELADRDDRISSLEEELDKLRGELGVLRSSRGSDLIAPVLSTEPVDAEPPAPEPPAPVPGSPRSAHQPPDHQPPDAPPASEGRSRVRSVIGVLLAIAAVSAAVVGVSKGLRDEAPHEEVVAPLGASPSEAAPVPATTAAAAPTAASSAPATTDPPPRSAAPAAEPPTEPSAEPAPSEAGPAEPPPSEVLPPLLSFQAWLTVKSPVDAEVVVQGQPVGRTNQRLLTRCGPRNVRLRHDGSWLSPGEHVRIVCMEHTEIHVNPSK